MVLDHTPFYAESGGQIGDAGLLLGVGGALHRCATRRRSGRRSPMWACSSPASCGWAMLSTHRSTKSAAPPLRSIIRRRTCCTRR